jgi:hypothetical protein
MTAVTIERFSPTGKYISSPRRLRRRLHEFGDRHHSTGPASSAVAPRQKQQRDEGCPAGGSRNGANGGPRLA